MSFLRAIVLLLAAGIATQAGEPAYRLVVNPANPTASLPRTEIARLFLKKATAWPDGAAAVVIDQERSSAVRQAFSLDVHQKNADGVAAYWQTAVFSGRDVPPAIAKSDTEVLAFVRANPGAVGYVAAGADLAGVKVLAVK